MYKHKAFDGPGVRSVLFLQGCNMKCPGCHNKAAQRRGDGELRDVGELAEHIIQKCHTKRLTVSGGEPLEQWDSLKELIAILVDKGFDICIYIGWNMDEIPDEVFQKVNYVKSGKICDQTICIMSVRIINVCSKKNLRGNGES